MIMTALLMCGESLCDDNFMRRPTIGLDLQSAEIFRSLPHSHAALHATSRPSPAQS